MCCQNYFDQLLEVNMDIVQSMTQRSERKLLFASICNAIKLEYLFVLFLVILGIPIFWGWSSMLSLLTHRKSSIFGTCRSTSRKIRTKRRKRRLTRNWWSSRNSRTSPRNWTSLKSRRSWTLSRRWVEDTQTSSIWLTPRIVINWVVWTIVIANDYL